MQASITSRTQSGLSYSILGEGDPLIVLGGGPGFSSRIYQHFLGHLAKSYRCLFWDYRGTGNSVESTTGSFKHDLLDFQEVLEAFDLGHQPYSIFAHSYGGVLALQHSVKNSKMLKKLFLSGVAAHLGLAAQESMLRKQQNLSPDNFQKFIQLFSKAQLGVLNTHDQQDIMLIEGLNQMHRPDKDRIKEFSNFLEFNSNIFLSNQDWIPIDFTQELKHIQCPCFVFTGDQDIIVPPQFSSPLIERIDKSISIEFKNCGHWPFIEQPEKFWQKLLSY